MLNLTKDLFQIFERDLHKLQQEIELYPDNASVWKIEGQIKNSAGNLCLHLCGNLQTYIGKNLGGIAYTRNRDYEFAAKDIDKEKLLQEIGATKNAVKTGLEQLTPQRLEEVYPEEVFGYPMTTGFFLIHLSTHLTYHLGQINYHRRLLAKGI